MARDAEPRITTLSRTLPPDVAFAVYQWVAQFIHECGIYESALDEGGVMEFARSVLKRVDEGEQVPDDLLRKVREFHNAHDQLFYGIEIEARDWVANQFTRPEVVEFSGEKKAELYRRHAQKAGLSYLPDETPKRKKRDASTRSSRAEGAG